jgi:Cu(I)/Ag(I) efflux system protein CusF
MKRIATVSLLAALTVSGAAVAQSGHMKGMDMTKDMNSGSKAQGTPTKGAVHKTSAVVKSVDRANGKVTLSHEPVKSLNWPSMTMAFAIRDKALFDKLAVGQKVDVEFTHQGGDYVVTAVK